MKSPFISALLLVAALSGIVGPAAAGPVVAAGSTYSIFIEGFDSGAQFIGNGTFDGAPTVFTRFGLAQPQPHSQTLTLTESQTDLGNGTSLITIDLSADSELFPVVGETGIIGLGVDGNGLNLLIPVSLDSALIRLFAGNDLIFTSANQVPILMPGYPWDGSFPSVGNAFFIDLLGGAGVTHFSFEFQVTENGQRVPEPGSVVLGAIALLALAGARWRRRVPVAR